MASLITIVRSKFLDVIRSVNPPAKWKILVVDEHSQKLLNFVLKQFDILEENVTVIELITSNREPQPQFEALYLLMPTSQNVDRIIKDFSSGNKQYAGAHLFFIEGLNEELFKKLTSSPAEPFLKGLQELFINFWPTEAQTFSLRSPATFFNLYSPPRSDVAFKPAKDRLLEDLRFMSKCIANLCITLEEFPLIRYYMASHHPPLGALRPNAQNRPAPPPETGARWRTNLARGSEARDWEAVETDFATKLLAFMVQENLEEYKKANPDFPKHSEPARPRGTLIITDRCMDMMAPFLHEFTYQAMVNDLLPIEDGVKYKYKFQSSDGAHEDMVATLADADSVWIDVRHRHMREVIDKLMADFNKFMQDNAGFQGQGAANLNDMRDMLVNLPQYQEQREKFSLHLNMAQESMRLFEQDKLPLVANVEQCCATGLTAEGKSPKTLVEEMVPLLDSRDIKSANKARIVALYIQYRDGVPDEDRRRLYQHARLSLSEQDAVNSLVHFGIRINRGPNDRDIRKKLKQRPKNEEEYELSRFKPLLRGVIEDHGAGKLDQTVFPYVKDAPLASPTASARPAPTPTTSLRSQKPAWHRAARPGGAAVEIRQRVLVFVLGGMTYSETREAYDLSTSLNKDVFIGSTHTVTPHGFVDDLKVLELGGVGSKAVPNGLRDLKGPRPYQEFYDEKYYTRDAPQPKRVAPNVHSLAPPKTSQPPPRSPRMSPSPSYADSSGSHASSGKDEKKKEKKHWFKF